MRKDKIIELIATGGGIGHFSNMPGTLGSLEAFVIALFFRIPLWLILLAIIVGIFTSGYYSRKIGTEDPSEVVIDEIAGTWIAMYGLPPGYAVPALFLFRVVDILKPVPVCTVEKLSGGWGIMADDILGGIIANIILIVVDWLFFKGGFSSISNFI